MPLRFGGRAGREAVEDDGEQPRRCLLAQTGAGGGLRGGHQQGVDLGQLDVWADEIVSSRDYHDAIASARVRGGWASCWPL